MIKFVTIFLLSLSSFCYAKFEKYPKNSVLGYESLEDYFMKQTMALATGQDGQMTFEDYKKRINSLTRDEKAMFEDTMTEDFANKDYNKDGLVSNDEYRRYVLLKEQNRKKTKNEERLIKRAKRKNTYVDPSGEISELTKKLDEEIKKQEEANKK